MTTCSSCGAENPPDSIYCEDCGAQMQSPESQGRGPQEPLENGSVLVDRYTIESVVESGPILRYRATRDSKPFLLLESRRTGEVSQLSRQRSLLEGLSGDSILLPNDYFQHDDYDYAAIPWPGQRMLDKATESGPMDAECVTQCLSSLLDRLSEIHGEGLISRSVQPSRIWGDEQGQLHLDLWERACHSETPAESEEVCSVTPGFSAPEMYGLGTQDSRLDLFSVSAVGYFLLTGSKLDLDSRESFFVIQPPEVKGADGLVRVIMKGLRKRPEERFADAAAMKEALLNPDSLAEEIPPAPVPTPVPSPRPAAATPAPRPQSNGKAGVCAPTVAMLSHVGCVRSINQDACLELRFSFYEKSQLQTGWLVTVIDGMGGEAEGDKAASLALRTIAREVVSSDLSLRDGRHTSILMPDDLDARCQYVLERALRTANRTIFEYASLDDSRRGMGCTITACLVTHNKAYYAQVGDTRGYHGRQGKLRQVTTDHSLVARLVAMGSLTPEGARNSPQRSVIYRALGTNPDVEVDLFVEEIQPGDRLVLCSDGVWEYFEAGEFEMRVMESADPMETCQELVDICLKRGADDNATVAIVQL